MSHARDKLEVTRLVITKRYWETLTEEQQKEMREFYNGYPGMFILHVEGIDDDRTTAQESI